MTDLKDNFCLLPFYQILGASVSDMDCPESKISFTIYFKVKKNYPRIYPQDGDRFCPKRQCFIFIFNRRLWAAPKI